MSARWRAVDPPRRLPAISGRWAARLRPVWFLAFALALLAQAGGFVFAFNQLERVAPAFAAIGLSAAAEDDGLVHVDGIGGASRPPRVTDGSVIVAIERRPVPGGVRAADIAARLRAVPGPMVRLTLRAPDGRIEEHALVRSPVYAAGERRAQFVSGGTRLALRLGCAALATLSLLASAALLYARCPREPVAMLFSFSFIVMAMTVDPPIQMWIGLLADQAISLLTMIWWPLVVVALAAFPSGRFEPAWLRWMLPAAVPVGVLVSLDQVNFWVSLVAGAGVPVLLTAGQVVRYRGLGPGIERQQIKWATFGFAVGFALIAAALTLIELFPGDGWAPGWRSLFYLSVLCLFSLGFAALPLGLLVALTRFRLWEADLVISRSAAYAFVTMVVGAVWAGSADLVKLVVVAMVGESSVVLSTVLTALIAAGVFAPTQSIVLGWTKRRFTHGVGRLRELPARLTVWRSTETAPELGLRALGVIVEGVHADGAALIAHAPGGGELVAARDLPGAEALAGADRRADPRFPVSLELTDEDGPVGTLLLGPRSDGNRYNRNEREALAELARPLAEAIRIARGRLQRELGLQRMVDEMQQRLARLEGGGPAPRPA